MKDAVEEEISIARLRGEVDVDGIPLLTVVLDGVWSKRSYRTNYNALSGAAAIVGYYTQKVIWMASRNKFCVICNKNESPSPHKCNKNFHGIGHHLFRL